MRRAGLYSRMNKAASSTRRSSAPSSMASLEELSAVAIGRDICKAVATSTSSAILSRVAHPYQSRWRRSRTAVCPLCESIQAMRDHCRGGMVYTCSEGRGRCSRGSRLLFPRDRQGDGADRLRHGRNASHDVAGHVFEILEAGCWKRRRQRLNGGTLTAYVIGGTVVHSATPAATLTPSSSARRLDTLQILYTHLQTHPKHASIHSITPTWSASARRGPSTPAPMRRAAACPSASANR